MNIEGGWEAAQNEYDNSIIRNRDEATVETQDRFRAMFNDGEPRKICRFQLQKDIDKEIS